MFASTNTRCDSQDVANVVETLRKGWLAPGSKATELENEVAKRCGKQYGLMANTPKSALMLACIACEIGQSVDVLVPAIAPKYHIDILNQLHATIHYADINPGDWTICMDSVPADVSVILVSNMLSIPQKFDNSKYTVIEDHGPNMAVSEGSDISIVSFDEICGLALFKDQSKYNEALGCRDWGRVGDNDEDVKKRYDGWVLGKNVKYDNKFVFAHIGFNFKSCEMSATLALRRLNECRDLQALDVKGKQAGNGRYVIIETENCTDLISRLAKQNVAAFTLSMRGMVLAEGSWQNAAEIFAKSVVVLRDGEKDDAILAEF